MSESVLEVRRGIAQSWPVAFKNANDTPIDLTGYTIAAVIAWRGGSQALSIGNRNDAAGTCAMSLTSVQSALVPKGLVSELTMTFTSSAGQAYPDTCKVEGI